MSVLKQNNISAVTPVIVCNLKEDSKIIMNSKNVTVENGVLFSVSEGERKEEIKENTLVISDKVDINPYWQRNIYDITIPNDNLKRILSTFREDIIFYASDLCGTDFKQVIDFSIRR